MKDDRTMEGTTGTVAEFDRVVKDYPAGWLGTRKLRAVDGVSFRVERGEVFALLGPNRAGKTTLVKTLLSLCQPTEGRVFRFGQPASARWTLKQVGYVHENQAFPRYLTARELLHYYGALSLMTGSKVASVVPDLLARVGLADRADEAIARFSKGMVQRLGLAQALLCDPDLLVLDEPNEGLDLEGRRMVFELVRSRRAAGKTVLLVSHVLHEVEQLCDRAAVILGGKLAFFGPLGDLTNNGERPLEDALAELYSGARKSSALAQT